MERYEIKDGTLELGGDMEAIVEAAIERGANTFCIGSVVIKDGKALFNGLYFIEDASEGKLHGLNFDIGLTLKQFRKSNHFSNH